MTHSGLVDDGIARVHWQEMKRGLGADSGDAIVVVWAPESDAATAAREVLIRARETLEGIPAETRQAHGDGTTGFERILPGPDRMYPDTDTPPLPIPDTTVTEVRARLGEAPWERKARYEKAGLDSRSAGVLSVAPWADLFDELAPDHGPVAQRLATVLEKRIPYHARRNTGRKPRTAEEIPEASRLGPLVRALEAGEILPEALVWAVDRVLRDSRTSPDDVVAEFRIRAEDEVRLEGVVSDVTARALKMTYRSPGTIMRWAMGEVMREFFGRVPAVEIAGRLAALLEGEESNATGASAEEEGQ
jgi:glutamyl-tRNA(Gln) amidotransferase subunit E